MSKPRNVTKRAENHAPAVVRILDQQEYKAIREKPRTVEIHLASALFPQGKITTPRLKKILARKVPTSGNYNAVFHFGSKLRAEMTGKLNSALKTMPKSHGEWFVVYRDTDKSAVDQRVKSVIPRGSVSSSDIDNALATFSKNPS